MAAGIVITGALFLAGCAGMIRAALFKAAPASGADRHSRATDSCEVRPALVSYVLANCSPGTQAYVATILDLAARGPLSASDQNGTLWIVPGNPTAGLPASVGLARLADFEKRALDDVVGRLKDTGGAPLEVLADACRADVNGTWTPFSDLVQYEARSSGLSRPLVPVNGWTVLSVLAAFGGLVGLAATVARLGAHASWKVTGFAALGTLIVFLVFLRLLDRHLRFGQRRSGDLHRRGRRRACLEF